MTKKHETENALTIDETKKDLAPVNGSVKKGLEEPSQQEDIEIPRAKLMQSNSPEVADDPDGVLCPGKIINSVTKEVLPVEFVPIFKFTEWIRFNPRNSKDEGFDANYTPGAMIWRSRDPNDRRVIEEGSFGPCGERPRATKFLNFFAYFPGVMMPVIVPFCNTSFKAGKKINSMCQFSTGGAIFERKYKLTSKPQENDKGKFFVFETDLAGQAAEEEYQVANAWYEQFRASLDRIKVHEDENDIAPY